MQRTRATLGILSTVGFLFGCDVPQNELTRTEENGQEICEGRLITTPAVVETITTCLLYTSPSPRDGLLSRMPSSA